MDMPLCCLLNNAMGLVYTILSERRIPYQMFRMGRRDTMWHWRTAKPAVMAFYSLQALCGKLKQGFGRLIRTETDTGVCAILDSRAEPGAAYHDRVIAALPPFKAASDIEDIRLFMRKNKPQSYFKDLN